jgi:hypothetical protein
VLNVNPTQYVYAQQIVSVLREFAPEGINRDFLYRRIVAPLRDDGVILASCNRGYKIPISVEDITIYLNQTHTVVAPMLHRMEKCRDLIKRATLNNMDVLDDPAFIQYKRYFD